MTDSEIEMLRLAAKAAGHEFGVIHGQPRIRVAEGWTPWNPRDDSGQALELAVCLRIDIFLSQPNSTDPCVEAIASRDEDRSLLVAIEELGKGDENAATRLAIVRAAAAMAQGEKP